MSNATNALELKRPEQPCCFVISRSPVRIRATASSPADSTTEYSAAPARIVRYAGDHGPAFAHIGAPGWSAAPIGGAP